MIYTIGYTKSYEEYFERFPDPAKAAGGSVWKTREAAEVHAKDGFSVYGVSADWQTDTKPTKVGDWHDLLRSADLIRLTL